MEDKEQEHLKWKTKLHCHRLSRTEPYIANSLQNPIVDFQLPTTLSHVSYMAIYIVERTEFLMEFILFRYHKIKKEIFIFLTYSISNVFFSCNPQLRLCQLRCFLVPLNEIVLYCIVLYCIR